MLRAMTAISFQKNCGSANLRQEHDAICDWVFDKEPDFKAFEEGTTKLALLDALVDWQKEDKLFENQQLFKTPIVRNGKKATVGYQPEIWKTWE